jgi:hypothetical protein
VRRHAQLLDFNLDEGCNARVWVQVQAEQDGVILEQGTKLLTRTVVGAPSRVLTPGSPEYREALEMGALVFETMHARRCMRPITSWSSRMNPGS